MENQRRGVRIKTRFETLHDSGTAILMDISYTGAIFEDTTTVPAIGSEITLYVFLQPVSPVEVTGRVVRHFRDGFAIECKDLSPEVRRLVDDAAAVVGAPEP